MELKVIYFIYLLVGFVLGCLTMIGAWFVYRRFNDNKQNKYRRNRRDPKVQSPSGNFHKSHFPVKSTEHRKSLGSSTNKKAEQKHRRKDGGGAPPRETLSDKNPVVSSPSIRYDDFLGFDKLPNDPSPEPKESFPLDGSSEISRSSFQTKVINTYNEAARCEDFGSFRRFYSDQIKRVGPEESQTGKVILVEKNDGDYYAIHDRTSESHLILPRLGIAFADFHYGPGKMGEVFDCPDFDPTMTYERINIDSPAKFRLGGDGIYILEGQGHLILGNGKQL